ncbi:MAG TPA: hypothetical protein VGK34_08095 [Armatimonadota bacterium]
MLFPKSKLSHTSLYQGNKSDDGWLILDIGNMELEGVTKLYIDLREVGEIKDKSSRKSESVSDLKRLLGGD